MSNTTCRWGILGAAEIARRNWEAIRNTGNATLVAVASRDQSRAQAFIDACQAQVPFPTSPRAVGRYDEILESPDIDAVYIPLPTGVRKSWVIKAAQAGKHVLCEKPCGISTSDLEEMIDACNSAGVQFMDGVMFVHSDRLNAVRESLDDGRSVGEIRRITSQFSFGAPPEFFEGNIRADGSLEPAGCLGDLGWYNIRISLWTMGYEMPTQVSGNLLRSVGDSSVPTEFSGEMIFSNGVSAGFYCSFVTGHQQWTNISGTEGNLTINDFVLPFFDSEVAYQLSNSHFNTVGCKFNMERHLTRVAVREYSNNHPEAQETKLFRKFSDLALNGVPDPHWPEIALKTQTVMNACLESARNEGRPVSIG